MKKALITGISGQDGSYLSQYLISMGYDVYGIIRRNSVPEHQESRIHNLNVTTFYGDVMDASSIEKVMAEVMPDEIYNLAAQSHVRISNDIPKFTAEVNAIGALNVLDAYRRICPKARFYQASSSEMFGNSLDADGFQRETTPMHPVSPYGCSKLFAYSMLRHYRHAYGLHACNGILFNHESPRRASNFVTQKVIKGAIRIKMGLQDTLEMGRLDTHRDWGHSKDYVRAMHQIINHDTPDDFVVSTMQTHSVQEMIAYVFEKVGVSTDKVFQNPKYFRTEELKYLKGDSTKIRETLEWKPYYSFEKLMDEMIEQCMEVYSLKQLS